MQSARTGSDKYTLYKSSVWLGWGSVVVVVVVVMMKVWWWL